MHGIFFRDSYEPMDLCTFLCKCHKTYSRGKDLQERCCPNEVASHSTESKPVTLRRGWTKVNKHMVTLVLFLPLFSWCSYVMGHTQFQ